MADDKYFSSFKIILIICTALLFLVSFYLLYNQKYSSGFTVNKYGIGNIGTIDGYGALMIAILFLIFGIVLFRPDKKINKDDKA